MRGHDNNPTVAKHLTPTLSCKERGHDSFSPREKAGMRGQKIHNTKPKNHRRQQTPLTALPYPR